MRSLPMISIALLSTIALAACGGRSQRSLGGTPNPAATNQIVATLTGLLPGDRDAAWFQYTLSCGIGLSATGTRDNLKPTPTVVFDGGKIADGATCTMRITGTPPAELAGSMVPRDGAFYVSGESPVAARRIAVTLTPSYTGSPADPKKEPGEEPDAEPGDLTVEAKDGGACKEFNEADYTCAVQ